MRFIERSSPGATVAQPMAVSPRDSAIQSTERLAQPMATIFYFQPDFKERWL